MSQNDFMDFIQSYTDLSTQTESQICELHGQFCSGVLQDDHERDHTKCKLQS